MTLCRLILPDWRLLQLPGTRKVIEGLFSDDELKAHNVNGYNVFYLPNGPKDYQPGVTIDGTHIDTFAWVFVDMDLKDGTYESKDQFLEVIAGFPLTPTKIVDSGGGIHAYWQVSDLDAMSFLKLQRRLCRALLTDEAVSKVFQLMRLPGFINTKRQDNQVLCEELYSSSDVYTCEQLDKALPPITLTDETYCQQHFDKTYSLDRQNLNISDELPPKFGKLLRENHEVKDLWAGSTDDRSKSDYRLGHVMFANGFTREEAASVLVNSAKALNRAPIHRRSYAENIIDKIWTFEDTGQSLSLSSSVEDILRKGKGTIKGTPFRCHKRIDNTVHGFRLGQVIGLVAGSGVGKTAFALNMFRWFAEANPDYHHFFIPLEQPANEIADRWQTMCGSDTTLHKKVHVLSNYDDDGNFRHLSFDEIREYVEKWQKETGHKIGCIVIDHIGALKKKGAKEETQDLMTICHAMKAFAVQTNTLLVMQSQSSREKAGIGDLELNKDAAYGTIFFEAYCDYVITLWQPLKRCHNIPECPTVTAFKFCKIRHKKARQDIIQEDVCYYFYFDSESELMRDMTQDETVSFTYFLTQATNKRKADRKTDLISYQSVPYQEGAQVVTKTDGARHNNRH
jgi:KaiC/GvpD/RAD55 family RecA-like ATPase